MTRRRFTPEQIVAILREVERKKLFRKHGISEQAFYRWKRYFIVCFRRVREPSGTGGNAE